MEIKNIRHELMLNECSQEFVDSIRKPWGNNGCFTDTIYQGTVINPNVKSISEKLRRFGNRFNVSTIFKTKQTLRGTLIKTGQVRDVQLMKGV
jgi:hypothetical protein